MNLVPVTMLQPSPHVIHFKRILDFGEGQAVFGIPDPEWGELVMACVVLKPGMALSAGDLTGHCRQFLANYKIPRRVEFSDAELPKSGSGKILKRILRERFWAHEQRAVG